MSFNIRSAKLTGNPDASGWSQTYEFAPADEQKLKIRGKLFALISTSSQKSGLDSVITGREVLSRLHEEYFGKIEDRPFEALKKAVEKVINEFSSWDNVQIAAISLVEDTLYIAVSGGSQAHVFREDGLIKLVESLPRQVVMASGYPKDNDVFIIGTGLFFNSFPKGVLKGFLKAKDPGVVVESFAPLVHTQELEGSLGIVILNFARDFPEEKMPGLVTISPQQTKQFQESWTPKLATLGKAQLKAKNNFLGIFKVLGKSGLYLKSLRLEEPTSPKKKTSALVGISLLVILSVSIYFGIVQKRKTELRQTYESQIISAEHELEEAYDLSELNPQRSRELFDQARSKVLGLSDQGIDDPKIAQLQGKIEEGQEKILGQYQIDPQLFVDLSLFSESFFGKKASFSEEVIYILDEENQKIISVAVGNKKTQNLAGPSLVNEAKQIAAYSDRIFTLNTDGVYELDGSKQKVVDADWEADVLVHAYAANLYILDKAASRVYRYSGTDEGFGSKHDWFSQSTTVDLSGTRDFIIDVAVWVVADQKDVFKFTFGVLQNFTVKEVFPEIDNVDSIFTSEDSEFIYLLERDKSRVVVIDKNGGYKAQYTSDRIKNTNKIIVSEKERKLFFLTGGQLLITDLKH